VHFTTDLGTFQEADSGTPTRADVTVDGSGKAVAHLVATASRLGTINLKVSASVDGKEPSASATVPLKPSGGLAASVSFSCQHQNIARSSRPG